MTKPPAARLAEAKLTGQASCARCKYLYLQDEGYSNWTVMETIVECAINKNSHLPREQPYRWAPYDARKHDDWVSTQNNMCEHVELIATSMDHTLYPIQLDVDHEITRSDLLNDGLDELIIDTVLKHAGRNRP